MPDRRSFLKSAGVSAAYAALHSSAEDVTAQSAASKAVAPKGGDLCFTDARDLVALIRSRASRRAR